MENKSNWKRNLFIPVSLFIFLVLQALIREDNLTAKKITGIVLSALVGSVVAWLVSIGLLRFAAKSKWVKKALTVDIETKPGETVLFETVANHFKGIEAVGGKLMLTNERLVFKSQRINFQNHQLSIPLSGIASVKRSRTLGLVNNGLTVLTTGNTTERFVVQQPEEWMIYLAGHHAMQD